jgi:hypothetical protein
MLGGYNTLALNPFAAGLSSAGPVAANLVGFSALEITGRMDTNVNVVNFGASNTINQVILDHGYDNGVILSGLGNHAELDFLWGNSNGNTLHAPVGTSTAPNAATASILLDSQATGFTTHHYGQVDLNDTAIPTAVGIVTVTSTAAAGVADNGGATNKMALEDAGITTLNINSVGGGDPDAATINGHNGLQFQAGSEEPGSGAIQDGDIYLDLSGSTLAQLLGNGGLTAINAPTFLAGIKVDVSGTGHAVTVVAPQTTFDNITFGTSPDGNVIEIGNSHNTVTEAAGSTNGNTIILTQQTASVYSVSANGDNVVSINDGVANTIIIGNSDDGHGNAVTVGTGAGAANATSGDTITLGAGGNVFDSTVHIEGNNTVPTTVGGVPVAIDTVNILSTGGGNNLIIPDYVTGSFINLGAHTEADTIQFDHVTDSSFGFNDTLTGFVGGLDIVNLKQIGGTTSFALANGVGGVAGLANANTAGNDAVIYDFTDGTLFDFTNGATFSTATAANSMEVQVGVTGINVFNSTDVHFH